MKQNILPPSWRHCRCWNLQHLPLAFRARLLDTGSTTRRMRKNSGHRLTLRVLCHGWQLPRVDEWQALAMPRRQFVLVREVLLFCNERPWMYARTAIPRQTLKGKGRQLRTLSDRPLGLILFADPQLQRGEFELALLQERHAEYQKASRYCLEPPTTLWARRSWFQFYDNPLLLTEVFLPHPILLMD